MILKKTLPWGKIKGKLSLTPEQAKRMLDFDMKPGAIGVVFVHRKDGTIIVRSLMKPKKYPKDPKSVQIEHRVTVCGKIVKEHLHDLIRPIWSKFAKKHDLYSGPATFMQVNLSRLGLPPVWKNLLITTGTLPKPLFIANYCPAARAVIIKKMLNKNISAKAAIFNIREKKLYHPFPCLNHQTSIPLSFIPDRNLKPSIIRTDFIAFLYTEQNNQFSDSQAIFPKRCTKWKRECQAIIRLNKGKCEFLK